MGKCLLSRYDGERTSVYIEVRFRILGKARNNTRLKLEQARLTWFDKLKPPTGVWVVY